MKNLPQWFIGLIPIINLKEFLRIAAMKNRYLALLTAIACIRLASLTVDAQVNILPLGDSVTSRGAAPESSYRYYLYADLTNAGYQFSDVGGPLAFVGTQSGCQDG